MQLTKCPNGHFYDSDKYQVCPHCDAAAPNNPTVSAAMLDGDDMVTQTVGMMQTPAPAAPAPFVDDERTISFFDSQDAEPHCERAVGWLVCINGKLLGQDFRLKSGRNFIGRDAEMDICLKGELKVSRQKHAVVIYDPKQNVFLAQPGESKELFYLNGELVVNAVKLARGDKIEVGDVELLFIPLCDEKFSWTMSEG